MRRLLIPYVTDTSAYVARSTNEGRKILFEGAHGTMLDIDYGTYPFVTSSNCIASAVYAGGGVPPGKLDAVLGISKAYTTRVGAGPFPTEIHGHLGDSMREEGAEFGSATGRPRRIGWFDAALARYAIRVNGLWGLALTKLDVLTGINPLKICVGYKIGKDTYDTMPPGATRWRKRSRSTKRSAAGTRSPTPRAPSMSCRRMRCDISSASRELCGIPIAMVGWAPPATPPSF